MKAFPEHSLEFSDFSERYRRFYLNRVEYGMNAPAWAEYALYCWRHGIEIGQEEYAWLLEPGDLE